MKRVSMPLLITLVCFVSVSCLPASSFGQNAQQPDVIQRANNTVNKISNVISVFQPYLLKARQLYYDARQLAGEVKNSAKDNFGKNGKINNTGVAGGGYGGYGGNQSGRTDSTQNYNPSGYYPTGNGSNGNGQNQGGYSYGNTPGGSNGSQNQAGYSGYPATSNIQSYLPGQNLPVNNPASVNNDGSGNWGNQNNGLYGNCLDALTGTVMGMGEASQKPGSVDLIFYAPTDGQNTYHIITPGFARNNGSVSYWTEHASDQVMQWTDVNETEVALTRLTVGQFELIQNNNQIQNAVRNAQNYAGYYSSVGQKLDGQVFAVKAQMENREVYALIAIIKQVGTSGNNGYLKIRIKSSGIDQNHDGQIDAGAYIR